jgi:hypothetical protein
MRSCNSTNVVFGVVVMMVKVRITVLSGRRELSQGPAIRYQLRILTRASVRRWIMHQRIVNQRLSYPRVMRSAAAAVSYEA